MSDDAPHSTEQELLRHRLDKLERLRARGIEPYPYSFARSNSIAEARALFEDAEKGVAEGETASIPATLAGRMISFRDHGKSIFANIRDESGQVQLYFNQKRLGDEALQVVFDMHLGAFVVAKGEVHRTR
ncbi:MAG: OB-fold nucleic acid binding domain-containing protein, partial [Candidatus Hydrogenedentales bacterium]